MTETDAFPGRVAAVVTTGIYCLPECTARPSPGNVREFALAAAAEAAGFRACLRCRPYRQPQQIAWTSNPELVCRAVRLILAGALDGATEAQLGARLGVSPRHLRRLCVQHLGVTPDGLARSARTHFARRLLDDSDLSIAEVADAAGFGSVRQLNRACQQVFRLPPRALRAKRRRSDRLTADGGLALRLAFRGRLDWNVMLTSLRATAIPGVETVSGETYRRTIRIDGDPGVLELAPGGNDHLMLTAHLPHWGELMHIVARARRIANLDNALHQPRTPGAWDGFETGVRAIVGQNLPTRAANELTGRLSERFGTPVPGLQTLGLTHIFPEPQRLAIADLRGLPPASREAVAAFARAVRDDTVRLDGSLAAGQLEHALAELPGIQPICIRTISQILGERPTHPQPLESAA
jgi:AraC family transcriptional regulator, regulatory protein of adaptative response / DNA-3-methyladenine glycosylase II